ncbi:MAG TPA: DUF6314 family protein [Streptosporangiaceae bacterium]|jgi:hypothetical protein
MTWPVADPAGYLAGSWRIERRLSDDAAGTRGTFTGTAVFTPDGGALAYEERGVLDLGHWSGESYRRLRYAPSGPGVMAVAFADGSPFHDLDLRTGSWRTHHPCRADAYEGAFTVISADEWRQRWRVRGPAKDQIIESVFRRAG